MFYRDVTTATIDEALKALEDGRADEILVPSASDDYEPAPDYPELSRQDLRDFKSRAYSYWLCQTNLVHQGTISGRLTEGTSLLVPERLVCGEVSGGTIFVLHC